MVRAQRGGAREASSGAADPNTLEARAKRLIDEVLRPLVAVDGGEIELVSISEERAVIRLTGAYSGCPGRAYTVSVIQRAMHKALSPTLHVDLADV